MSLIIQQTLPYTSQQLNLEDPSRWSRLFPLIRPSIKTIETSNSQIVVIDTELANSSDVLIVAVGKIGSFSSKILSQSHVAAFTVERSGDSGIFNEDFSKILKENEFPIQNGVVVLRSGSKRAEVRVDGNVLEVSVEGELEFDHLLSLLLAVKSEVKASFEKTQSLLEHFLKTSIKTTSTFHEKKSGNGPSVIHRDAIAEFNSAKKAIDKDLSHLLNSRPSRGEDLVYSVHLSDINGLSRLENNILAHEISQYFQTKNLSLNLSHSTIQSPTTLSRGWSISLSAIPDTYLSSLQKATSPLSQPISSPSSLETLPFATITSSTTQPSKTTTIPLFPPSTILKIIHAGCTKLMLSEPQITHYDTLVGDGDCGTTLSAGASFILSYFSTTSSSSSSLPLDSLSSAQKIANTLSSLVEKLEINMGGTSGALYCIFLSSLSSQLVSPSPSHETFPQALNAALGDMMRFTKARRGDRTMMDCLIPFVEGLVGVGDEEGQGKKVERALEEARKGVEATRDMEANLGRSSYLDESATRGVPDPGAYGLLMLLEGMVEGMDGGAQ